ncbi:hypothetical protein E1N66_05920 [Pantoea allii]|nr:hypothetical protein [Pantoea allii]THB85287.1 hypothetical protein E1N66_05920 [Pantoea allii]
MSGKNMAEEIDDLINKICRNVVGGELTQLGALFTPRFLDELSEIIYKHENLKNPKLIIDVNSQLCWIDKAPYAKLCSGIPFDKKVELGDAMFIFDEKFVNTRSQSVLSERNKAFILQAKITGKETHVCRIPVTTCNASKKNSTYKEFELYSKWSKFDISYASNTTEVEESNVDLMNAPNSDACRFAWYGVAASTRNTNSSPSWPCRWMVGKALMNDPCDKTLGALLSGFYQNNNIAGSQVGEYFNNAHYFNPAWERVIYHVLARSKQLGKPSYFPLSVTTQNRIISSRMSFHAPQLITLLTSFGLDGQCVVGYLFYTLQLNPHLSFSHVAKKILLGMVSPKKFRPLFNGVSDILRLYPPVKTTVIGTYKPRKFPIIRVTVERQENE